jgi:adenylate kinase family enzyme
MNRIVILGFTGSGKTSLAAAVAERLRAPHVELDALFWEPDWRLPPAEVFRARVARATAGPAWVLEGNPLDQRAQHAAYLEDLWPRAETIVWLDYPRWLVLWRLWWRTVRRILTRDTLWGGNRESLRVHFLSRQSMFPWAWRSFPVHRELYRCLVERIVAAGGDVVHLRSPREARLWLLGLPVRPPG